MSVRPRPGAAMPFLIVHVLGGSSCSDPNRLEESQVTEVNLPDRYEVVYTDLREVTDTRSTLWTLTGTRANVDVTNGITSGNARLQIRDPSARFVYSAFVRDEVDGPTQTGTPGPWQIDVILEKVTGEFRVVIERAP